MKHFKNLAVTIAMLLVCAVQASAHDFEEGGIYYNITDSYGGLVEVTYAGNYSGEIYEYRGDVVIPSTVWYMGTQYQVSSIGNGAFDGNYDLSSVTIPNSVISIGDYAFCNSTLSSINIPSSVTSIGYEAFGNCYNISSITIPSGVNSIGDRAFYGCNCLTSIQVDENNEYYDSRNGCNAIIETSSNTLLVGCSNSTIPYGVTSIGNHAFDYCYNLSSITIPSSVTRIGDYAFFGCSSLTTITIPESVTSIGEEAFYGCSSLSTIVIPSSVSSIENNAFRSCSSLTSISVEESNAYYDSRNGCNAIIETGSNTLIVGCGNSTIPEGVTSIGNNAFYDCGKLTSIEIPESVTSIGDEAFYWCSNLSVIVVPESVTFIGRYAFYGTSWYNNQSDGVIYMNDILCGYKGTMPANTSIVVREGTKSISPEVFSWKENLVEINLPESLVSIGYSAFYHCSNLINVNIPESVSLIGDNAFLGTPWFNAWMDAQDDGVIYMGSILYKYKGTMPENTAIVVKEGTSKINASAFFGCSGLVSITIPESVTSIGSEAFQNCSALSSVTIPSGVTSIGNSTFSNCSGLTSVTIPASVTSIGSYAFSNCRSLDSIIIPEGVTSIEWDAFSGCSGLSSITIPSSVKSFGSSAFYGCGGELVLNCNIPSSSDQWNGVFRGNKFTKVTIGSGVTLIGDYAFYDSSSLEEVVLEDSENDLLLKGYNVFYNSPIKSVYLGRNLSCNSSPFSSSLSSLSMGKNVTSIDGSLFSGCSGLTGIYISSLESWCNIDFGSEWYNSSNNNPLYYAKNLYLNGVLLRKVVIPNTVTTIKKNAFYGYNGTVVVPESVTSIGRYAFYGVQELIVEAMTPPSLNSSDIISNDGIVIVLDDALSAYKKADYWNNLVENMTTSEMSKREVTLEAKNNMSALHQALGDTALPCVVDLTINGTINSYDFMVMLNKMNKLRHLNLSNAHIVYNGYEHYTGYHTENNKLPAYAFYQKNLLTVKLPQDITSIGDRAFSNCSILSSISIPESVTSVGSYAFNECSTLADVTLEGKAAIGTYAFSGCSKLSSINITEGVSSIGSYAFNGCNSLKDITIPKISGAINTYAFQNCSNLENLTVLDGSTSIGSSAFYGCWKLKDVSFDEVSSIGSDAFGDYYSSNSCRNLSSITILKGLTSIGSYAFGYCTSLKDVNLPEGNISIGSNAFYYCSGLREINIPDGVTSIGSSAFTNCSGLKSIKLPTTLQIINSSAFSNCSSLAEVHIPSSVRNIHESAFSGCTNMKKVYVYTIEPTAISQNTFAMNSNNNFVGTLYAPKVSYYVYWYDTQWSQFEDIQPFDEPYDNFYLKGDLELNDSTGVVQGTEGEKPDAELGSNSGLVTDGSIDQELGDVEIEHNGTNGGSIIAGGNSSVEVDNLTFRITVTGGRWYFFCFPFDVRREDIKCENGADWVFRYYDGEERAQNGRGGWKNVTSDGDGNHLKAATGYIFQCSKSDVLVLSAKNQKIKQEKKYNELVEHVTQNMQDASWNFVGNPYLSYYDITGEEYSAPITIWNGSSYVAIRPGDDDYVLSPFEAFFVQKPEGVNDIEYDPEQQMTYYQMRMAAEMKAARRRTQTINPDRLLVNLTLSDTATTDRTRVVFNNEVSLDYEMDCDAAKFTANGVPQLYTIGNRAVKYAINERPVAEGIVTVGYTAPVQGNYTLAAPRMDVPVCLKDNRTGIIHDFSEGSYTFMTEAGTFEDRFTLMMKSDATAIDKSQLIIDEEAPLYNTKGQWVDEPQGQGVYIKDNRKVVKL